MVRNQKANSKESTKNWVSSQISGETIRGPSHHSQEERENTASKEQIGYQAPQDQNPAFITTNTNAGYNPGLGGLSDPIKTSKIANEQSKSDDVML